MSFLEKFEFLQTLKTSMAEAANSAVATVTSTVSTSTDATPILNRLSLSIERVNEIIWDRRANELTKLIEKEPPSSDEQVLLNKVNEFLKRNSSIVKSILRRSQLTKTPLTAAIKSQRVEVVKLLLEQGAALSLEQVPYYTHVLNCALEPDPQGNEEAVTKQKEILTLLAETMARNNFKSGVDRFGSFLKRQVEKQKLVYEIYNSTFVTANE